DYYCQTWDIGIWVF
nr:immunoglobulin light chain junction region [Macaca mulatta]MOV66503.1 immunoglobulin light chain junction region [Macaca mulatta]MOV66707.1 immunoglobulin light chain junction region [Macaca mulatta]MOV66842.1 immunoglobulin light chain junction region [Macaca mulatta]MOV66944.1 immunoglobulin light chain junction region [Macaca mulatta]